jgi:hypothetical protein
MPQTFRETTRLRRALGPRASSWGEWPTRQFVLLREAKLVSVREDEAANIPKLDFDFFVKVYSEIDVLWLSPTVFINSRLALCDRRVPREFCYSIVLETKASVVSVCVYTLLPSEQWEQAQLQPISFLRQLMKDLPADYLSSISLPCAQFDPPSLLSLLSILPPSLMSSTSRRMHLNSHELLIPKPVKVHFQHHLSREQFDAVLSHHMIPYVMLDVTSFNGTSTENEKVAEIRLTNDIMRDSSTLRHAEISDAFPLPNWNEGDEPFTINPHLESLEFRLDPWISWGPMLLNGISRNPNIQHLEIFVYVQSFDLKQLLSHVLPGHASLKTVKLVFERGDDDGMDDEDELDYGCPLEAFASLLVELRDSVAQLNLLHFSVLFPDYGTKERIISSSFQAYWDKNMVPILALNWYRSEQDQRTARGRQEPKRRRLRTGLTPYLALRVLDVNRGSIYHLVTTSAPSSDMAPTNATLIYRLLHETDAFKTR